MGELLLENPLTFGHDSPDVAAKLHSLRFSDELQTQLDQWATENSQGNLGANDHQQYEAILRAPAQLLPLGKPRVNLWDSFLASLDY